VIIRRRDRIGLALVHNQPDTTEPVFHNFLLAFKCNFAQIYSADNPRTGIRRKEALRLPVEVGDSCHERFDMIVTSGIVGIAAIRTRGYVSQDRRVWGNDKDNRAGSKLICSNARGGG
jgi:hypothetical protein